MFPSSLRCLKEGTARRPVVPRANRAETRRGKKGFGNEKEVFGALCGLSSHAAWREGCHVGEAEARTSVLQEGSDGDVCRIVCNIILLCGFG